jgi:hypothetical protein
MTMSIRQQHDQNEVLPSSCILHMLDFISDRSVWNAVASSNKEIYKKSKSKTFQTPPWPINYKLFVPGINYIIYNHNVISTPIWSPDGCIIGVAVFT